jgi:hypothetical protein
MGPWQLTRTIRLATNWMLCSATRDQAKRLEESQRRFEAGETRTIPHEEVRRRLGLDEPASEEPPSLAED